MLKAQDLLNKCQLAIELKVLLTFVTAIAFLSQYFFFSYLSLMKNSTALRTGNLRKSKSSVTSILPFIHSSPQSLDSKFDFPTPSSMLSSPTISATKFCNLHFFLPKSISGNFPHPTKPVNQILERKPHFSILLHSSALCTPKTLHSIKIHF